MAEHDSTKPDLSRVEHKIDLLLRLSGLTCDQIQHLVEAKDASEAQQALIEKLRVAKVIDQTKPA